MPIRASWSPPAVAVFKAAEECKVIVVGRGDELEEFAFLDPGIRIGSRRRAVERPHGPVETVAADRVVLDVRQARIAEAAGVHDAADDPAPFRE